MINLLQKGFPSNEINTSSVVMENTFFLNLFIALFHPAKQISNWNERNEEPVENPSQNLTPSKKNVCFSNDTRFMLIPTKEEYYIEGVAEEIWYQPNNFAFFRQQTALAVKDLIQQKSSDGKRFTYKEALKALDNAETLQKPEHETQHQAFTR